MDILNKHINQFNFDDIEVFCQQGISEGVQIDYKMDFPAKSLSKHFAAFSNTRGGLIIIGVEEDKKTGIPILWTGVDKDAKRIEKIYQEAANVEPIPNYEVHITDEKNGKVFVLVRIQEGDNTPYYVQNDSNIWVRTGNVSTPIDIASPDRLALLFTNKEKAEKIRNLYIKKAEDIFVNILDREERDRLREIDRLTNHGKEIPAFFSKSVINDDSICRICIQPYFPKKSLTNPKTIKDNFKNIRSVNESFDFPNSDMNAIPEGLLYFKHGGKGRVDCQQVYGQGLISNHFNNVNYDERGARIIFISFIAGRLLKILKFADIFYSYFHYHGSLSGFISINNAKNVFVREILSEDDDNESFISNYRWEISTDTNVLKDPKQLKEYYMSLLQEIYWHFGYENISDKLIQNFLKQNGLEL
ncbi:MAG: ATP-binding protein [Candidatus Paceibacterota bacterium]